jgi:hypothetical protein
MVVNAGKAAIVESKCRPRTGSLPHCAPRIGPSIGATATKRCLLPLRATAHCNCRRPSANQWWKRRRDNTPSPGMALCGYSVGISQIIWARTQAGCSSRSAPASIRKSSTVPPDSHGVYLSWSVLLAIKLYVGNFMRRFLYFCTFLHFFSNSRNGRLRNS